MFLYVCTHVELTEGCGFLATMFVALFGMCVPVEFFLRVPCMRRGSL